MSFSRPERRSNAGEDGPFLVVGYGGIGDHVRCLALVRHVAAAHPGATIDLLCRSPVDQIVRFAPDLRKAVVDDTPHRRLGVSAKARLAGLIRRERYRRAYVVSRTFKSALLPFLAGIPERVGWLGEGRVLLINRIRAGERRHPGETEKICALAGTGWCEQLAPRLVVDPDELEAWRARQADPVGAGAPILALAPGAHNLARQWPAERYGAIARFFADQGWRIWVLGGPRERAARDLIARMAVVHDFIEAPLADAVLQIRAADLFLGSDSGLLHLAGALGTPSVGLFGPFAPEVSGPRNACVTRLRPADGGRALDRITVDEVKQALLGRIRRPESLIGESVSKLKIERACRSDCIAP